MVRREILRRPELQLWLLKHAPGARQAVSPPMTRAAVPIAPSPLRRGAIRAASRPLPEAPQPTRPALAAYPELATIATLDLQVVTAPQIVAVEFLCQRTAGHARGERRFQFFLNSETAGLYTPHVDTNRMCDSEQQWIEKYRAALVDGNLPRTRLFRTVLTAVTIHLIPPPAA